MNVILEIKNLTKKYKTSSKNAVNKINFEVYEGEFFCLLGVNGAGKSTTINMLCTLLEKTDGNVKINNFELGKQDNNIRNSIGVVFQGNVLDNVLTVEENLLSRSEFYGLNKAKARERIDYLAKRLNMLDFMKSRYNRLSGGQRRKCDIARALICEPKILFLDEPTTGLDPQSRIELWETINDIRKTDNMNIFLTTHYMEETEDADRVAIIDNGNILCIDTPQQLKSKYSTDILKLVIKEGRNKELEKHISNFNLVADTYIIELNDNIEAIDILSKIKPYIHSFEMKKGNMDNVFLNVVGRNL